jgi:hypothetical protein
MGMTPYEFMDAFVEGNYEEFLDQPDCIRRGFNAAVSASHMADHYYEFMKRHDPSKVSKFKSDSNYIESLYKNPGECFKDVRGIANAYKHLYTKSSCQISSAGSIDLVKFNIKGVSLKAIEQNWVSSPDVDGPDSTKVIFRRRNGTQGGLLDALTQVRDYWRSVI